MKLNIEYNDPILDSGPNDTKRLPLIMKILALLCILQAAFSIIIEYTYLFTFVYQLTHGATSQNSTTIIILYAVFLAAMLVMIVGLMMLGIYMLCNLRRLAAYTSTIVAIAIGLAAVTDIMLVGIKITSFILLLTLVILIAFKSYIDPSLSQERKLQKKLKNMQTKKESEEGTLGLSKKGSGYAELNYFNIIWIFVTCCILGYIVEIIWHMTVDDPGVYQERAGFLFGPFSPIYGIGGILMTVCLNRLTKKNIIVVFVVSALLGGFFEYFASLFLEMSFGVKSWDYSHLPFNIEGRTSLRFFIMWGIFGTVWVKLLFKPLIKIINKIPWKLRYSLTVIISIIVFVNALMTLQALDCWYERSAGKSQNTPIEQFYNKYFNDDFMHKRFENMQMNPNAATRGTDQ
ncbi:MAG: putative ABC transporter permease [Coriobacteriia bacterium]|nr:putative ABC transporter permease [Coriobacteriia bacterium]